MALEFNNYIKGANGIPLGLLSSSSGSLGTFGVFSTLGIVRVYPSTVPYPTGIPNNLSDLPAGHIAQFTGLTFDVSGSTIILGNATNTTATTLEAGTVGWFSLHVAATTSHVIVCDSIGNTGADAILKLNALTFASGASMTIASVNIRVV